MNHPKFIVSYQVEEPIQQRDKYGIRYPSNMENENKIKNLQEK